MNKRRFLNPIFFALCFFCLVGCDSGVKTEQAVEEYYQHIEKHLFSNVITNIAISKSDQEKNGYIENFSRLALQYFFLRKISQRETSEDIEKMIKVGYGGLTDMEREIFRDPYKRNSDLITVRLPDYMTNDEYAKIAEDCLLWLKSL